MKKVEFIVFANLPTKIEKLSRLSNDLDGLNLYVKRDDQTGSEISGNKVRKLEYSVKEALNQGCDYLITCGGIQSNHARATAAVAAKLGLGAILILRDKGEDKNKGNLFLNKVLGAEIKYVNEKDFSESRTEIMEDVKADLAKKGHKGYIIPVGASNGIGTFGYFKAMEEILEQEKALDIKFDAVVTAVGSGGTYAGLFYANKVNNNSAKVYGINVCDDAETFKDEITEILHESFEYVGEKMEFSRDELNIIDGYVGDGYAMSTPEELKFIQSLAKQEGLILDPVYTGKAMGGLVKEIKKGTFKEHKNILFIHTGGLFGLFPKSGEFEA